MGNLLNMSGGSLLKKGLPYDAEIEYLESSGTQYIIADIPQGELVYMRLIFNCAASNFCMGSWYDNLANKPSFSVDTYNGGRFYITNMDTDASALMVYGFTANVDDTLVYQNGTLTNNGVTKFTSQNWSIDYPSNKPVVIFGLVYYSTRVLGKVRFKRITIQTINGSVDFIPVRIGQTGYLYDKVSGQLFGNAGTGSFILGPDVN